MSGFVGSPPLPDGIWVDDLAEAWQIYREAPGKFGYPIPAAGRWLLPRPVRLVNAKLAAEARAVVMHYGRVTSKERGGSQSDHRRQIGRRTFGAPRARPSAGREAPKPRPLQPMSF